MPEVAAAAWAAVQAVAAYVGGTAGASVAGASAAGASAATAASYTSIAVSSAAVVADATVVASASVSLGQVLQAVQIVAGLAALAMKPKVPQSSIGIDFKADPNGDIPFVLGECGTGGNIIYNNTHRADAEFLSYITVLSGQGPIQEFVSFTANDLTLTFDPTTWNCNNNAFFDKMMYMGFKLGTQPDTAFVAPSPLYPATDWTSAHKTSGFATTWWWLRYATARYPGGTPKPMWRLKGIKVYDPRLDSTYPGGSGAHRRNNPATWTYSENPYIHAINYLLGYRNNGKIIGGVGARWEAIDHVQYVYGANVADANGWKISGVVTSGFSKFPTLAAILASGGGQPANRGALMSCLVSAPMTSVATLQQEDLVTAPSIDDSLSWRSRVNGIIPKYKSAAHRWAMVAAGVPVSDAAYVTQDRGVVRNKEVSYDLVSNLAQAAQLAYYDLANLREFKVAVITVKPKYMGLRAGDCITLNMAEGNVNSLKFVILKRAFDPSTWYSTLTCRVETDAKHAAALAQTGTAPVDPGLPVPNIDLTAPSATQFDVLGGEFAGIDGSTTPGISIELGAGEVFPDAAEILMVDYREVGSTDWRPGYYGPPAEAIEMPGLAAQVEYEVSLRYSFGTNLPSERRVVTGVTVGEAKAGAIVGQGDLATLDLVDTPQVVTGALTRITADQDVGTSVTIISRGTPSGHVLIKTMNFEVDENDSKFTVVVSFAYESTNSNVSYIWLKIGQTAPTWAGGGSANMTNADAVIKVSAYNGPATQVFTFTGLPAGTNTLEIHAGSSGSGSHVNTANDCYFSVTEDKKPL